MRKEISAIVKVNAKDIIVAVVENAINGEFAPARFALEMAGVFPSLNDGEEATEEEDCLAKTLLGKLQFPPKPGKDEGVQAGDAAGESGAASKNERKVRSEVAKKETE